MSAGGESYLLVFDCLMPVPPGYVLKANETEGLAYFHEDWTNLGTIRMSGYRQEMHEESWEVLSSASVGDLTVEELRYAGEGLFSEEARRSIVVHDGEIQVLFMSSAMRYARRAAEACMARPAR